MYYNQNEYNIKCEWGLKGIEALFDVTDVFIIVDVLSFTTCVDTCVSRGANVYPYLYNDITVKDYAKKLGAELAVSRRDAAAVNKYTLSMSSLLKITKGTKLVLPSPNGSAISFEAGKKPVIAACLRNARAVAEYAVRNFKNISVIPAGEKWADGTLRPAVEDMIGAGAVIADLKGSLSPESKVMLSVFNYFCGHISETLRSSISGKEHESAFNELKFNIHEPLKLGSSGRELLEKGFENDINLASDLNSSNCVPVLINNCYVRL